MTLIIIDIIASLLQSILFAYGMMYCIDKEDKINKKKLVFMIIMFFISVQFFTGAFGENWGGDVFVTHVLSLIIAMLFYKKKILSSITAYTLIYFIIQIYSVIFGNIIFEYVKQLIPMEYITYETIIIIYMPEWILLFFCYKYMNKIKQIYKFILNENFTVLFFIMSVLLDFILAFYVLTLVSESQLMKNSIYMMFFIFLVVLLIYFWKVHQKSEQINKLNQALEIKNSELGKIKHDYGAQISYLYGLCLMERFDDLKNSLKDIINNNQAVPTAVEINNNENSILSLALKPAIEKGIHVIIEEKCDFSLINMDEMELYRVISNIVNNAIKATKGKGIIIARSYEYLGHAVIKIENNGPKIEENHLNDIFKVGFTTKENSDKSHGYGLSIVKELVEKHSGKICVKSTDVATEFKIILPICEAS